MNNPAEFQYKYINSATTTTVFTGRGKIHNVTINTTAAGAIHLRDGITGTTGNVGVIKASAAEGTYNYDAVISTGLLVTTAGASDITITYTQG